ncbi:hypothetical protein JW935_20110, partial [candidate division KSB1 bacterium]|nr:hypothetical protein [candidate division KSB1 bacterium]
YQPHTVTDVVPSEPLKLSLHQKIIELPDITVSQNRDPLFSKIKAYNGFRQSTRTSGVAPAGIQDSQQSIHLLPGISAIHSVNGIQFPGGSIHQSVILYEDIPLYNPTHFYGYMSTLNFYAVSESRVHPTGYSARYGDGLSGLLLLDGPEKSVKKSRYGVGVDFLRVHGFLHIPVTKRLNIFISGQWSYMDFTKSPAYNSIYYFLVGHPEYSVPAPVFRFSDTVAQLSFIPADDDSISFTALYTYDTVDRSTAPHYPFFTSDITDWGNLGASLKWKHSWSDNSYSSLALVGTNAGRDYDNADDFRRSLAGIGEPAGFRQEMQLTERILKFHQQIGLLPGISLGCGLELDDIAIENIYTKELTRGTESLVSKNTYYIEGKLAPFPGWNLTLGGRAVDYSPLKNVYYDPRLFTSIKLAKYLNMNAGYGTYHQYLFSLSEETRYHFIPPLYRVADEKMEPGKAQMLSLGATTNLPWFSLDLQVYQAEQENLVKMDRNVGMNFFDRTLYQGSGQSKGVIMTVQNHKGPFTGYLSYHTSQKKMLFEQLNDGRPFPADDDRQHELKAMAMFNREGWEIWANWVYASGQRYTPVEKLYRIDFIDKRPFYFELPGSLNSARCSDYQRFDIGVNRYVFRYFGLKGRFGVAVLNVFRHQNIREKDYQHFYFGAVDYMVKMLDLTPMLYLSIENL